MFFCTHFNFCASFSSDYYLLHIWPILCHFLKIFKFIKFFAFFFGILKIMCNFASCFSYGDNNEAHW